MHNALRYLVFLAVIGLSVFWVLTRPDRVDDTLMAGLIPDATRGEAVFWAGGCASCHAAPGAEGDARLVLAGGMEFPSPFGSFRAPNISPDPVHGLGGWSAQDLANAMLHGTSPTGSHYYPAFPYTSYARTDPADIADLHAFLMTLPASTTPSKPHGVGFPFNIRRSLGGWKLLFARDGWIVPVDGEPAIRGRYLVEALGHCGECHTPRNALGGLDYGRWLQGAASPDGKGRVPGIAPGQLEWSDNDIAGYLTTGFTPEYDVAGGHMAEVVQNLAKLPEDDIRAIVAYLRQVPAAPAQ